MFFKGLDFKGAQTYARQYPALNHLSDETLLFDLYALDKSGKLTAGVDTYSRILIHMRYLFWLGLLLRVPLLYSLVCRGYRHIADNRMRVACDEQCVISKVPLKLSLYDRLFNNDAQQHPKLFARQLAKFLMVLFVFATEQFNSLRYLISVRYRYTAFTLIKCVVRD